MRCWSDEAPGARRPLAAPGLTLALLLLATGCSTSTAPRLPVFAPVVQSLPLRVDNGGINTGGGPVAIGIGVTRQVQLVSGDGSRVGTGVTPATPGVVAGSAGTLRYYAPGTVARFTSGTPAASVNRPPPGRGVETSSGPQRFAPGTD